jgi:hypothetical protein
MGLSILSQASRPPFKAANGSTCGGDSQGQQLPILGKSCNGDIADTNTVGCVVLNPSHCLPATLPATHPPQAFLFGPITGNGYLSNLSPSDYAAIYDQQLPDSITGSEFIKVLLHVVPSPRPCMLL